MSIDTLREEERMSARNKQADDNSRPTLIDEFLDLNDDTVIRADVEGEQEMTLTIGVFAVEEKSPSREIGIGVLADGDAKEYGIPKHRPLRVVSEGPPRKADGIKLGLGTVSGRYADEWLGRIAEFKETSLSTWDVHKMSDNSRELFIEHWTNVDTSRKTLNPLEIEW
jgi:hypothetical protein